MSDTYMYLLGKDTPKVVREMTNVNIYSFVPCVMLLNLISFFFENNKQIIIAFSEAGIIIVEVSVFSCPVSRSCQHISVIKCHLITIMSLLI